MGTTDYDITAEFSGGHIVSNDCAEYPIAFQVLNVEYVKIVGYNILRNARVYFRLQFRERLPAI